MIDPITFEVIRNALLEATEEMAAALRRSAYSVNIKTRTDFSCAFFDAELRTVAQASGQPVQPRDPFLQLPDGSLPIPVTTVRFCRISRPHSHTH